MKCYQTPTFSLGAKRQLAQSMSRELGPKGLHIAHIIVDGIIETPFHASDASPVPRDVWHRRLPNDGIIDPADTREVLIFTLETCLETTHRGTEPNTFGVARF